MAPLDPARVSYQRLMSFLPPPPLVCGLLLLLFFILIIIIIIHPLPRPVCCLPLCPLVAGSTSCSASSTWCHSSSPTSRPRSRRAWSARCVDAGSGSMGCVSRALSAGCATSLTARSTCD